ncbi:hypothetical protein N7537_000996 [Penicillium hordei]|uniref:Uncharacterized protein n=1 Tax=Penicillium hordei TaxID=40994 RepID=A0AAD6EGD2_9EURO|nr:uncharacterized protein N7537_000996 [Penicillium hordei]KAJ5615882.1 hypothetical protein N7537_000996 [Penicillium hordei]
MADPLTGGPEPQHPRNHHQLHRRSPSQNGHRPSQLPTENRKRTRIGDAFAPSDPAGRITAKVWKQLRSTPL